MIGGESFANEELSALRIAIFIVIKLYIYREIPQPRTLLVLLVQLIDGKPIVDAKSLVVISSLESLCQVIAKTYREKNASITSEYLDDPNSEIVNEALFKIMDTLWKIETADDLSHLIRSTFEAVEETSKITTNVESKISLRSPLGRYVQKIAVSVKLLHFNETINLFNCIRKFRASSFHFYDKLRKLGLRSHQSLIAKDEVESSALFPTWSRLSRSDYKSRQTSSTTDDDALIQRLKSTSQSIRPQNAERLPDVDFQFTYSDFELLIDAQISLLERYGTPTPKFLKSAFNCMASSNVKSRIRDSMEYSYTSSVHFLDYLENLNCGDYHGAFNSLHQYFDYMVSKGSKHFYHFALISKASLHQFFSEDKKALDSIEEAISVARENKDNATLTYVLSWLFDFMRKKPSLWDDQTFHQIRNQSRLLDFLIKKSHSVSLSLAAISFRFESELLMNSNGSFVQYYESLFKASYISIHDSIPSFIGICHSSSTLWQNIGMRYLSVLYNELGIFYSEVYGTTRDNLEFELHKHRAFHAMGLRVLSVEELSSRLSTTGTNIAESKYMRYQTILMQAEIELHKGRMSMASELLSSVPNLCEVEPDFVVRKLRLAAMILIAQKNFSSALDLLDSYSYDVPSQGYSMVPNIIHLIKLNFLRAHVLIASGSAQRAFSLVVQHSLLAKKQGYRSLVNEGFLLLLRILNETGYPRDAYSIALVAIPAVICEKDLNLTSLVIFEIATSCCAMLEQGPSKPNDRDIFEQLLHFLSSCISGFKNMRNLYMLNECFRLEDRVSSIQQLNSEIRDTQAFDEFKSHSAKGLDVMAKRLNAECSYGYLNRISLSDVDE